MIQDITYTFQWPIRPPFAGTPPALAIRRLSPRAAVSQILSEMHTLCAAKR